MAANPNTHERLVSETLTNDTVGLDKQQNITIEGTRKGG